jgi:DNA-binding LytR/AlgR family response regulator
LFESIHLRGRRRPKETTEAIADLVPVDGRGGKIRLLSRSSVLYVQARADYVRIVADSGRFLVRGRIASFEESWKPFGFIRVHRGYLVNMRRVIELRPDPNGTGVAVLDDGGEVPVSRRKRVELRRTLRLMAGEPWSVLLGLKLLDPILELVHYGGVA